MDKRNLDSNDIPHIKKLMLADKSYIQIASILSAQGIVNTRGKQLKSQDVSWFMRTRAGVRKKRQYKARARDTIKRNKQDTAPDSRLVQDVTDIITSTLSTGLKERLLKKLVGA